MSHFLYISDVFVLGVMVLPWSCKAISDIPAIPYALSGDLVKQPPPAKMMRNHLTMRGIFISGSRPRDKLPGFLPEPGRSPPPGGLSWRASAALKNWPRDTSSEAFQTAFETAKRRTCSPPKVQMQYVKEWTRAIFMLALRKASRRSRTRPIYWVTCGLSHPSFLKRTASAMCWRAVI